MLNIENDVLVKCDENEAKIVISESVHEIAPRAFYGSKNLVSVVLPKGLTYLGPGAFWECPSLKEITFLGSKAKWDYEIDSVNAGINVAVHCADGEAEVFMGTDIESAIIPDGVSKLHVSLFKHCEKLVSVTIPESVKVIEAEAFCMCSSLKEITFKGTASQWIRIKKGRDWNALFPMCDEFIPAEVVHCSDKDVSLRPRRRREYFD